MTCRLCGTKFDAAASPACPFCGESPAQIKSGAIKSSMILISAGDTEAVYRSVKEVPPRLRRKLLNSTNGLNSRTILIADQRGREEIARAIQNLPSSLQRRFLAPARPERPVRIPWYERSAVKAAIAWLLGAGSMLIIWFLFTHRMI
jgi:hypothetical protein